MSSARSFGLEGIGRVLPVGIASLLGSGHIGRVGAREAEVIIHLAWRPWGRRHRGTRSPARPRARPGERRSVHKLVEMASRSCFGSFVYTVATREDRARGLGNAGVYTNWWRWPLGAVLGQSCTLLRLARVTREWRRREAGVFAETATHTNPEESSIETGQQVPGTHRRKVRSLSARRAPLVRREMRQAH